MTLTWVKNILTPTTDTKSSNPNVIYDVDRAITSYQQIAVHSLSSRNETRLVVAAQFPWGGAPSAGGELLVIKEKCLIKGFMLTAIKTKILTPTKQELEIEALKAWIYNSSLFERRAFVWFSWIWVFLSNIVSIS